MPSNSTGSADTATTASFLTLPPEIRSMIYNHCIPPSRLTPFPLGDTEWSMHPPPPSSTTATNTTTDSTIACSTFLETWFARSPPAFIFTSSQIYAESAPIFYSRATLEVAPAQQGNNWFNLRLDGGKIISHAYSRLLATFRFYRPEHLRCIRQAHVYSNQIDVIDGECYEALLQWLVEWTGVETIKISSRPMTRIRGKAGFDFAAWRRVFASTDVRSDSSDGKYADVGSEKIDVERSVRTKMRVVRVWTRANRPPWEYEKMMRLHCMVSNGTLVPMQIYFWTDATMNTGADQNGEGDIVPQLQLDPRWLTKRYDDEERIKMTADAAAMIDKLMGKLLQGQELLDYKNNSRHFNGESWVYQMIVIAKTI